MILPWLSRLLLIILASVLRPSLGCPSGCRCYSLTVECGSLGIKEIPQGVSSVTEVSLSIGKKLGRYSALQLTHASVILYQLTSSLIHSYYPKMIVVNQSAVTLFDVSLKGGAVLSAVQLFVLAQKVVSAHPLIIC